MAAPRLVPMKGIKIPQSVSVFIPYSFGFPKSTWTQTPFLRLCPGDLLYSSVLMRFCASAIPAAGTKSAAGQRLGEASLDVRIAVPACSGSAFANLFSGSVLHGRCLRKEQPVFRKGAGCFGFSSPDDQLLLFSGLTQTCHLGALGMGS